MQSFLDDTETVVIVGPSEKEYMAKDKDCRSAASSVEENAGSTASVGSADNGEDEVVTVVPVRRFNVSQLDISCISPTNSQYAAQMPVMTVNPIRGRVAGLPTGNPPLQCSPSASLSPAGFPSLSFAGVAYRNVMWARQLLQQTQHPQDVLDQVVTAIKERQRSSTAFKHYWHIFCKQHGGGIYDPVRHTITFLAKAMQECELFAAGTSLNPAVIATIELADRVKRGQRESDDFKARWWDYCDQHGEGKRDPHAHDYNFLRSAIQTIGEPPGSPPSFSPTTLALAEALAMPSSYQQQQQQQQQQQTDIPVVMPVKPASAPVVEDPLLAQPQVVYPLNYAAAGYAQGIPAYPAGMMPNPWVNYAQAYSMYQAQSYASMQQAMQAQRYYPYAYPT
ncbi:hypothetical protein DIPPA_01740 [Diplonema papillatum]|nr:hypothetical protein DIPPA_01740 [Diplonema papillatum]